MSGSVRTLPHARREEIVVHELPDETLVYDLKRDRALCLNRSAAIVWKRCDGQTTVAEVTALLERELQAPVEQEVVWFALQRLERARLLQGRVTLPSEMPQLSRRQLVHMGLAAALAVPLVSSVVAPTAAQAASCRAAGAACTLDSQCCSGNCLGNHTCHA
jgi:hypothetical protein